MRAKTREVLTAILQVLDRMDGQQSTEIILHAGVKLLTNPPATLQEFDDAMKLAEGKRLIRSVRSEFSEQLKWSITDLGRAALAELT